jgi:hypothetical protein
MRIVIATNFQLLDERTSGFWNTLARRLEEHDILLLLLTTNVHTALTVQFVEIPYTLSGYARFGFETPEHSGFLKSQIALEACWQTEENLDQVEAGAARCVEFFNSLLEAVDPELVLGWNTLLPQSRILQMACAERGIPCQTIERGLLPGTLLLDPTGNHLDSTLANSFGMTSVVRGTAGVSESVSRYRDWYRRSRPSKYREGHDEDFRRLATRAGRAQRTLLILAPVIGSGLEPAEQKLSRRTLPGTRDWGAILETISSALDGDTLLIFRDHPINLAIGRSCSLPAGVEAGQDASLIEYLELANHVVVIGGTTTAYESLVAQKPVMVVGRNMLMRFGAMAQSDGSDLARDVAEFLKTGWSDYEDRADRVLSFLIDHYLIMVDPELEPVGNRLDELVEFIDGYRSRGNGSPHRRLDAWCRAIRDSPTSAGSILSGDSPYDRFVNGDREASLPSSSSVS